jgi:iron(III) transport system substrate-binding protein
MIFSLTLGQEASMKRIHSIGLVAGIFFAGIQGLFVGGCSKGKDEEGEKKEASKKLVLYAAGDLMFSEKVIQDFEKETGLDVDVSSDTELTRGVALRKKIENQKSSPRADVYWNNELINTILLKKGGHLTPYKSASASDIPDAYVDAEGFWTAFGVRARIFLVNTEKVKPEDFPKSYGDMLLGKWKGKVGMAKPVCGTTALHAAALFELWEPEKAKWFFKELKKNEVVLCAGNAHVKDQVASGELAWGWTDTNDANVAILNKKPVKVIYPDQGEEAMGTLLIPHSVSMVRDCPHPENAKKFIDFLLRPETEEKLSHSRSVQIPVREGLKWPASAETHFIMDIAKIKAFNDEIDWNKVADRYEEVIRYLDENFVK